MAPQLGPVAVDRVVADLAGRQGGVVEHAQLLGLGLSVAGIKRRVRAGWLHVIHRGVYAVGHTALTARGRRFAAVLACGPEAMVSHQTAGDDWGIRPNTSPRVHVTVTTRAGRARPGIVIHRPRRIPEEERATRGGLAITSVARTLLDLADVVSVPDLRKAVERSEKLRLFDRRDIETVLASHAGRRTRKLRAALDQADFGDTRSGLESDFLALCRAFGLPRPEANVEVAGHTVDFFFRDHRLVVETDGWHDHQTKRAFEDDRRRDVDYAKLGLKHVRLTHERIHAEAADVAGDLSSLLAL
jgi:hypothetical protein